jgi:hypothetical protein
MSAVFRHVGKVAGIVAAVALTAGTLGVGGAATAALLTSIGKAAAVNALLANVGAQLTAKKPPNYAGSVADIQIGADMPSPMMLGDDVYCGGNIVHQVGYGPTVNDIPNTWLFMGTIYSVGGPIGSINTYYADFQPIGVSAPGPDGVRAATGYFDSFLHFYSQLGARPETSALKTPAHWTTPATPPDWGAAYKLSGKAAVGWALKWDSKKGKFASGAPQLGISGDGVQRYDARLDDTYAGGEGDHRWADPRTDKAGYDAATTTWGPGGNPGIDGLGYALGSWERNTADADSEYKLVFGIGSPWDGVVVEDFIELANVCDANGWKCRGVIWEPGNKMENLRRIVEAGGAEPCWKGGKLGLKINAPRVALDTIEIDDIFWDGVEAAAGQGFKDRINTVIPKCVSPAHKWSLQQSTIRITVNDYVAIDGEEKATEVPFDLVTDFDQAAQLAAYRMFDTREQGPIRLPVNARLRRYKAGSLLALSDAVKARLGLEHTNVVILQVDPDPAEMRWVFTMMTDNPAKHDAALAATGAAPDAITLPSTEELDSIINGPKLAGFKATGINATDATGGAATVAFQCPLSTGWSFVEIWHNTVDDFDTATFAAGPGAITGGLGEGKSETVSGLGSGLRYFWVVTYDDTSAQLTRTDSVSATVT